MKGLLSLQGICCWLNYCTGVFNKVTGCTRHSGSPSVVETASFSLKSMDFFEIILSSSSVSFCLLSLSNVQAPEIVCDSSNSTLSA